MYTKKTDISDKWDIPQLYHDKWLQTCSYFIPCHRKYSSQMGRLGVMQLNCTDRSMGRFGGILTNIQQISCILIGYFFYGMV